MNRKQRRAIRREFRLMTIDPWLFFDYIAVIGAIAGMFGYSVWGAS